eukprot:6506768-Alexandrium_andersonii.AAC.1
MIPGLEWSPRSPHSSRRAPDSARHAEERTLRRCWISAQQYPRSQRATPPDSARNAEPPTRTPGR